MLFNVEVNVIKQPEEYDKYYTAFVNHKPLDTGSRVTGADFHNKPHSTDVYCTFKIRS